MLEQEPLDGWAGWGKRSVVSGSGPEVIQQQAHLQMTAMTGDQFVLTLPVPGHYRFLRNILLVFVLFTILINILY